MIRFRLKRPRRHYPVYLYRVRSDGTGERWFQVPGETDDDKIAWAREYVAALPEPATLEVAL